MNIQEFIKQAPLAFAPLRAAPGQYFGRGRDLGRRGVVEFIDRDPKDAPREAGTAVLTVHMKVIDKRTIKRLTARCDGKTVQLECAPDALVEAQTLLMGLRDAEKHGPVRCGEKLDDGTLTVLFEVKPPPNSGLVAPDVPQAPTPLAPAAPVAVIPSPDQAGDLGVTRNTKKADR